jgi:hypothetical protein
VSFGILDITNGGGEDSTVTVQWNVGALSIPTGATDIGFLFKILESDGNPTDVAFSLNGTPIFSSAIPGNTANADVLHLSDPSLITSGGCSSWSSTAPPAGTCLDAFGVSWTDPVAPPARSRNPPPWP